MTTERGLTSIEAKNVVMSRGEEDISGEQLLLIEEERGGGGSGGRVGAAADICRSVSTHL